MKGCTNAILEKLIRDFADIDALLTNALGCEIDKQAEGKINRAKEICKKYTEVV